VPKKTSITGSELFIVDNSNQDWKALKYLHEWCQISKQIDVATGYFELDENGIPAWTEETGDTRWYLYSLENDHIIESPKGIAEFIRCKSDTPRHCVMEHQTLSDVRKKIEGHIKNTCLKQLQAPVGVEPLLKAWMELSES